MNFMEWYIVRYSSYCDKDLDISIDGHGREVGRIAATSAKASLLSYFESCSGDYFTSPQKFLIRAFDKAHYDIKQAFRTELTKQGKGLCEY